ncbi:MAG TPA: hypothetical protein VG367_19730 [Mucilaginibacter sp.]|jgi:sugar lactone lactonase YvrE|nr:hypothetical protein [Mucilaginibacter sp.]
MQSYLLKTLVSIFLIALLVSCSSKNNPEPSQQLQQTQQKPQITLTNFAQNIQDPQYLAIDALGNVYVTAYYYSDVYKVTPHGSLSVFAGNDHHNNLNGTGTAASFNAPEGIVIDKSGNFFVVDSGNGHVRKITPNGTVSVFAAPSFPGFYGPTGIAIGPDGNLYLADTQNNLIRKITSDGSISTFVGSYGSYGLINGNGTSAVLWQPTALAFDASGNLYFSDSGNNVIRKVTPDGNVTTFAGTGALGHKDGAALSATFQGVGGIAFDSSGNMYITDSGNGLIRKISIDDTVSTIADGFNSPQGIAIDASGAIYFVDENNNMVRKVVIQ